MEKLIKNCGVAASAMLLAIGVMGTFTVPAMATDEAVVTSETAETTEKPEIPPTFKVDLDESNEAVQLWAGKSLLLAGNNITSDIEATKGLMLVAGNMLQLNTKAEYGFIFGNVIDFAGQTSRDLYIAGNLITLKNAATIGRDVFVAGSSLTVETDLAGDLGVTADTVVFKNVAIDGNVNIDAANVKFEGEVEIAGALTYNDSANVSGLEKVTYGSVEAYHVEEMSTAAMIVTEVYGKFLSVAGLFIVMVILATLYPRLHEKVAKEATVNNFGADLAIGLGALVIVPAVALLSFFTVVAAPLGVILIALYMIAIYLAQGFAGVWLGHLILEKAFKGKGNIFAEAFLGILILGILALIPFVGVATGFVGMLLGLGLIIKCLKPQKNLTAKTAE